MEQLADRFGKDLMCMKKLLHWKLNGDSSIYVLYEIQTLSIAFSLIALFVFTFVTLESKVHFPKLPVMHLSWEINIKLIKDFLNDARELYKLPQRHCEVLRHDVHCLLTSL